MDTYINYHMYVVAQIHVYTYMYVHVRYVIIIMYVIQDTVYIYVLAKLHAHTV